MKQTLIDYAQYNIWANKKIINYLKNIPDEQISQTIINSFPSIRLTLQHISDAEFFWTKRLRGISPTTFPSHSFVGENEAVFEVYEKTSRLFLAEFMDEKEDFFQTKITYMTMSYGETTQTTYDMIHHCMNHSSFHRGQIIMMLRQLGHTNPPHLDFMLWKIEGAPII
jgi:uncharacterized damage-inducible protein DinB